MMDALNRARLVLALGDAIVASNRQQQLLREGRGWRPLHDLIAEARARSASSSGSHDCACGKRISANKSTCLACSQQAA